MNPIESSELLFNRLHILCFLIMISIGIGAWTITNSIWPYEEMPIDKELVYLIEKQKKELSLFQKVLNDLDGKISHTYTLDTLNLDLLNSNTKDSLGDTGPHILIRKNMLTLRQKRNSFIDSILHKQGKIEEFEKKYTKWIKKFKKSKKKRNLKNWAIGYLIVTFTSIIFLFVLAPEAKKENFLTVASASLFLVFFLVFDFYGSGWFLLSMGLCLAIIILVLSLNK